MKIGPYIILKRLGQGGMGVIYRAQHEQSGQVRAVKTVRLPDKRHLAAIRREMGALAELNHPGVVRIAEVGVETRDPWYAMELLEGQSLRRWMTVGAVGSPQTGVVTQAPSLMTISDGFETSPSTKPASEGVHRQSRGVGAGPRLAEGLEIIRQACWALAYLHGEGLVHRDLKPEHLFLTDAGDRVVLVDFGLALYSQGGLGRERLDTAVRAGGTVAYMAPEQILGRGVDPRADLYALGVILYELMTGVLPFEGDPRAIMEGHLRGSVVRPTTRASGKLARSLEPLVLKLLHKRPQERPGYAEDVASALGQLIKITEPMEVGSKARLHHPVLSGRQPLMEELKSTLDEAVEGRGALLLLDGEAGAGKTRLAREVAHEAQARGFHVLGSGCLPEHKDDVFFALRRVLADIGDICRDLGPDGDLIVGEDGPLLSVLAPSLTERAATPISEVERGQRLYGAVVRIIERLANLAPLLLIIDDIHHADEATLGVLERLARSLSQRVPCGLCIVVTLRSEESKLPPWRAARRIKVERLERSSIAEMVCSMLAISEAPRALLDALEVHSEGNPFFVAEYLRTAVDEGLLVRASGGAWSLASQNQAVDSELESLNLPDALSDLLRRRLSRLSPGPLRLATVAAIVGRASAPEVLLDEPIAGALADLDALVRNHILSFEPTGALRFVHDKIREELLSNVRSDALPELHRQIAVALDKNQPEPLSRARIAWHWERAGLLEQASHDYLLSAEAAGQAFALRAASQAMTSHLRLVAQVTPESVLARLKLVGWLLELKSGESALDHALDARREAAQLGETRLQARGLIACARAQTLLGDVEQAMADLDEARGLLDRNIPEDRQTLIHLLEHRADALFRHGRDHDAKRAAEEGLALSALEANDSDDTQAERGRLLYISGGIASTLGDLDEAQRLLEHAIALFQATGHRLEEASAQNRLGLLVQNNGDYARSRVLLERAMEIYRAFDEQTFLGALHQRMGLLSYRQSRYLEAAQHLEQARLLAVELNHGRNEILSLSYLAWTRIEQGDQEEARRLAQTIQERIARLEGHAYFQSVLALEALAQLGHVHIHLDPERAGAILNDALSQVRARDYKFIELEVLLRLGLLAYHQDDLEFDCTLLAHALELSRGVPSHRDEVHILLVWASLERARGDTERAERLLAEAEGLLETLDVPLFQGLLCCERGFLALKASGTAEPFRAQARALFDALALLPSSDLGWLLAKLDEAETLQARLMT